MLKHHGNAKLLGLLRILDIDGLPVKLNHSRIRLHHTKYDFHQGGFTSPVFTQDSMYFTGLNS